jgi:GH15 family glucan-1,4-alpha-glucosidase
MYLSDTCVLMTRFLSPGGVGELIDFMPAGENPTPRKRRHRIVRQLRVVRGSMRFKLACHPAFDYARAKSSVRITGRGAIFSSSKDSLALHSPLRLKRRGSGAEAEFRLSAGDELAFLLTESERHEKTALGPTFHARRAFDDTVKFWRHWVAGVRYEGRWREMVKRSAMTLKLLTFAPTGAIVAAPTMSLPERIGGPRNWDYRYTWIRDAAFTVYAFIRLGLTREAERFVQWIDDRAHEEAWDGSLQPMYTVQGGHDIAEVELKHLEGYRRSRPVRVGNAAAGQFQLDVYGELLDTVYLANKYSGPISYDLWLHLRRQLAYVCDHWREPDEGIWEVRGGRQQFVFSKLMCWVALDRGLRLAHKRSFPADSDRWLAERDAIYEEIMDKGWNGRRNTFVQHYGSDAVDASTLLMPLVFFISPKDPRMLSTIGAIQKSLASDSLVHRYKVGEAADDGLPGPEGTFSMCTFWMVEALTRAGRLDEARVVFEKMLSYASPLGLYAEQIGASGEALGNFPQAFTHLALISAAFNLNKALVD